MKWLCLAALLGCAGGAREGALMYETPGQADAREGARAEAGRRARGEAALARGDLDAAERAYVEAGKANPSSAAWRLGLAAVAERRHLDGEAERWLRDALRAAPELDAPRA